MKLAAAKPSEDPPPPQKRSSTRGGLKCDVDGGFAAVDHTAEAALSVDVEGVWIDGREGVLTARH